MRLYLITHAHTEQIMGTDARTWRLSTRGVEQSQLLAHRPLWDSVQRIVLSTEPKTRLTVEPVIAQGAMPVVVDGRFDELGRSGWIDDYGEQVRTAFSRPGESVDGWEPAAGALQRFVEGIDDLCRTYPDQCLALVSHGLVLSLYRAHLLNRSRVRYADWQALNFGAVALADPVAGELLSDFESSAGRPLRSS